MSKFWMIYISIFIATFALYGQAAEIHEANEDLIVIDLALHEQAEENNEANGNTSGHDPAAKLQALQGSEAKNDDIVVDLVPLPSIGDDIIVIDLALLPSMPAFLSESEPGLPKQAGAIKAIKKYFSSLGFFEVDSFVIWDTRKVFLDSSGHEHPQSLIYRAILNPNRVPSKESQLKQYVLPKIIFALSAWGGFVSVLNISNARYNSAALSIASALFSVCCWYVLRTCPNAFVYEFKSLKCVGKRSSIDSQILLEAEQAGAIEILATIDVSALKEDLCGICLEEMKASELIMYGAECSHYFHKRCIADWLRVSAAAECPKCLGKPSEWKAGAARENL